MAVECYFMLTSGKGIICNETVKLAICIINGYIDQPIIISKRAKLNGGYLLRKLYFGKMTLIK